MSHATDIDIVMDGIERMSDLPRPLQPTERLALTLEAQQWQQVVALPSDVAAPLRITQPLVQSISAQCMRPRTAELHELRQFPDESA